MKLNTIVTALVIHNDVSPKEIEATIALLTDPTVLNDVRTLRRIVKRLNNLLAYEDAPV